MEVSGIWLREGAGNAFQAEGTAHTKALRHRGAWCPAVGADVRGTRWSSWARSARGREL